MHFSTRDITMAALFAALTAVGAFIKVPVPHVPFTLQRLFVIFAGVLLGTRLSRLLVYRKAETIHAARQAGLRVCAGGIIGLGESPPPAPRTGCRAESVGH